MALITRGRHLCFDVNCPDNRLAEDDLAKVEPRGREVDGWSRKRARDNAEHKDASYRKARAGSERSGNGPSRHGISSKRTTEILHPYI